MGELGPKPEAGKRPADYAEVVRNFKRSRSHEDRLVRLELLEMAEGGNPMGGNPDPNFKGVREEYYKGWSNEDFKALLADLGYPVQGQAE